MSLSCSFDFHESSESSDAKEFVLNLPSGIRDKAGLLSQYERAGKFPSYFGRNWDALSDLLRDLSWIAEERVVIVHKDVPLMDNEGDLLKYLCLLQDAVNSWKSSDGHQLVVIFPHESKEMITRLLQHCESGD